MQAEQTVVWAGRIRRLVAAGVMVGLACLSRGQDRVALRSVARPAPGTSLRLADIADISGPQAAQLATIIVAPDGSPAEIELGMVRRAVEATPGINAGRIAFSGSSCGIRAAAPTTPAGDGSSRKLTDPPAAEGTVRQHVAARIAETFGASPADLRLTFEEHRDDLLNTRTRGRIVTAQQTGAGERVTLAVRVYEGDTLITQGTLAVGVLIRRDVGVLKAPVSRGEIIAADLLSTDEQWLPPTVKPAPAGMIAGRMARARIDAGDVVEERDVEASVAVKKGDMLSLDCISGSVVVRTTAKALADAKEGETIAVETLQWRKTVSAKVSGPGHAVAVGGAAPDEADRTSARKSSRTARAAGTRMR